MNLQENINRIKEVMNLITEEDKPSYVIFVSGIEKDVSHEGQLKRFNEGYRSKSLVKDFRYTQLTAINDFISKNKVNAVILFSKGASLVNKIKIEPNKIYCIEPWNGDKIDAGNGVLFTNIPAENMYIDNESFARGKGTKEGANFTDHKAGHFKALLTSVQQISSKLPVDKIPTESKNTYIQKDPRLFRVEPADATRVQTNYPKYPKFKP